MKRSRSRRSSAHSGNIVNKRQRLEVSKLHKIGVFVCWCGSNIAGTVDVEKVAQSVAGEPGVVVSTDYQYMCSEGGQSRIRQAIKEYGLTGIVVCSCSPRMHEATFRKTAQAAGLNPYLSLIHI